MSSLATAFGAALSMDSASETVSPLGSTSVSEHVSPVAASSPQPL